MEFEPAAVSAVFAHDRIALCFGVFVHGGAHVAQQSPRLNGGEARFHGLFGFFDQAAAFGRDFANAEHARRIAVIAIKNGGAVDVDDVSLFQHVLFAGNAMANNVVDGRAHALRESAVTQIGRRAAVLDGVIVNPLVDFLGGHARRNALGDHVEHAHVDGGARFDGLDVGGALQNVARGNFVALVVELLQALIGLPMALLVLFAAAAPAFVVASRLAFAVVHCDPRFARAAAIGRKIGLRYCSAHFRRGHRRKKAKGNTRRIIHLAFNAASARYVPLVCCGASVRRIVREMHYTGRSVRRGGIPCK